MSTPSFLSFSPLRLYPDKLRRRLGFAISVRPHSTTGKRVLISYTTHPFTITRTELLRSPHTNPWECLALVEVFIERGYTVDIIDWNNTRFIPRKRYDVCLDIHTNLERMAAFLPPTCFKLFYATGAHWKFQNEAEKRRIEELFMRRGIRVTTRRAIFPEHPETVADRVSALGNGFAAGTFAAVGVQPVSVPLPIVHAFPSPASKDFEAARGNYVFMGGGGAVHKGLDRVIEFFAAHPEYTLTICGPFSQEEDFVEAYRHELYEVPTITLEGRIDVRGHRFAEIVARSIGLIYPSSSEGQSGSVLTCMSAGLIPLVTHESGVTGEPSGQTLTDASEESIEASVTWLSSLSASELKERSLLAWEYVRTRHSYTAFKEAYGTFVDEALTK